MNYTIIMTFREWFLLHAIDKDIYNILILCKIKTELFFIFFAIFLSFRNRDLSFFVKNSKKKSNFNLPGGFLLHSFRSLIYQT